MDTRIGCHIEMTTTPGVDYPVGWSYQPDEPPLQLTTDHLAQIQDTLKSHDLHQDRYVLPQVIITPVS
jgi:hydroxyacylglutathione hydrolase